jgi:hypothetical protein
MWIKIRRLSNPQGLSKLVALKGAMGGMMGQAS